MLPMWRSLRGRMLWSLLAVILLGALIQGAVAYRSALREANQLFDYNMQQMALSLRSGMPLVNRGGPPELGEPERLRFRGAGVDGRRDPDLRIESEPDPAAASGARVLERADQSRRLPGVIRSRPTPG